MASGGKFGPKKIKFRGRVTAETDVAAGTGALRGRGAADMRAARIEVRITYVLRDDPAERHDFDDLLGREFGQARRHGKPNEERPFQDESAARSRHLREAGKWQRKGWDSRLRRSESYAEKWAYVRENPVRKGLVKPPDDWPYQGRLNVLPW